MKWDGRADEDRWRVERRVKLDARTMPPERLEHHGPTERERKKRVGGWVDAE